MLLQVLPLDYDPDIIADYWGRRPVAVATRIMQLLGRHKRHRISAQRLHSRRPTSRFCVVLAVAGSISSQSPGGGQCATSADVQASPAASLGGLPWTSYRTSWKLTRCSAIRVDRLHHYSIFKGGAPGTRTAWASDRLCGHSAPEAT